jgi:lipoprotein-anchoring transpeptidase ErfK/SrfK
VSKPFSEGWGRIALAAAAAASAGILTGSALASSRALPSGVRIAGIRVAGLDPAQAASRVKAAFAAPLPVVVGGTTVELHPAKLATAYVEPAVGHARSATAGTNVRLVVSVHGQAVRAAVAALARRFDRHAKNAALEVKDGRPLVAPDATGLAIDEGTLVRRVVGSLTGNMRRPLPARIRKVEPNVTVSDIGPMILINRALNRLTLFHDDNRIWRVFPVATGQAIYPTPTGKFNIVVKWVDPTWYPPTQDAWAQGLSPVPPGPGNPLGTRWMGLSAPGIGIHGTDEPTSIGYNASHGCIRMQVVDSEWLFRHVRIGTTVVIV